MSCRCRHSPRSFEGEGQWLMSNDRDRGTRGRGTRVLDLFKARGAAFQHQAAKPDWVSAPICWQGLQGSWGEERRDPGSPVPDTATPSRLLQPHHRAQWSPLAKGHLRDSERNTRFVGAQRHLKQRRRTEISCLFWGEVILFTFSQGFFVWFVFYFFSWGGYFDCGSVWKLQCLLKSSTDLPLFIKPVPFTPQI